MPAFYDQPASYGNAVVEDKNLYNQLPFFLVKNSVPQFAKWNVFDQLFGKIDWVTNQGNTMKGVTLQRSPVGRAFFFPVAVTSVANKDIYQPTESTEQAIVYVHKYETFQFNFLPNFSAFWEHIAFANKDIAEKIMISNNQFIETALWFNYQNVYLCGTGVVTGCPQALGNAAGTAAGSKTAAWLIATIQGANGVPGVQNNFTLRDAYNVVMALGEDFAAPPFSGMRNMPKDNDGLKEKFVIVGSSEAFMTWTFDPDVQNLKPLNLDLLFNDFKGLLFGTTTYKFHRYPIRFSLADTKDGAGNILYPAGTPIPPEVFDVTDNKWKPNPFWTSLITAPFEMAHILGDGYGKSIKVGPPPKEFAAKQMSGQKFYGMRWNGEIQVTDQILITDANGNLALNTYGENLKLQSKLTHGWLPGERRYGMGILYRRARPAKLV